MAAEPGPKRIRVHALSPGPLKTRAASGIDRFDELLERERARAPEGRLVSIEDVGTREVSNRATIPSNDRLWRA